VLTDAATFAARGTSVRCVVEVAGPLGIVECDAGQVAQVVQNLVLNACQASKRGATVTVRVARIAPSEAGGEPHLQIEVADEGKGIAPEHLGRIFEPFYTAREGGTGLGLSVSRSIVVRHGGTLSVRSEPGRGTTFTVSLPAGNHVAVPAPPPAAGPRVFDGRVLVMDDEAAVRRVATLMLRTMGFDVGQAEHGAAALEMAAAAQAERRPFRLAILDLTVVGGLGAADIVEDLRRVSPGIRVILSTGYARGDDAERELAWDGTLTKPYAIEAMEEAVALGLAR
jgi:CheY-like chemotaxis protein/anti-sigma regulatory factor (Ser/Thr protein kinase)